MSSSPWRVFEAFASKQQLTTIPLTNNYDERENIQKTGPTWPVRTFAICSTVLPCLFYVLNFDPIPAFSPKSIIYPHKYSLLYLLFAPWATPQTFLAVLSRLVQTALLWRLPLSSLPTAYSLWILIGLSRTLVGFVMSRAVGWAYPGLFRHYALYEMSSGFGPMLWAYLEITGVSDLWKTRMTPKLRTYVLTALYVALCWLDNAPWTYAVTIILTTAIHLAQTVLDSKQRQDISTAKLAILSQFRLRVGGAVIALLLVCIPYSLLPFLFPPVRVLTMPQPPFPPSPLLDILILSFPRPNGALILNTTISSYLPHLSNDIRLSLYTYSTDHPVFQEMQTAFQDHDITFHVNRDPRPDALDGHYLHLSEAFRWQNERGAQTAEWTMLVEDDFPICGADAGWEAVVRVMEILEGGRPSEAGDHKRSGRIPKRRGGFVGTGGSGLILHRSLLPTLIYILRTHADRTPRLPAGVPPRPVDVIVQDCLLGKDPMCPPWREEGLVITSRLVMDHIGGLASTNKYKPPNSDQWRCGWRHPFHGLPEVEVVPVEGLW